MNLWSVVFPTSMRLAFIPVQCSCCFVFVMGLESYQVFHSFHYPYLFDKQIELVGIVNHYGQSAGKESVFAGLDVNGTQCHVFLLCDDRSDVVDNSYVIVAYYAQRYGIHAVALTSPFCRDDSVTQVFFQSLCVRAVVPVDFNASVGCDKSEHFVTVDWGTTFGK